MFKARDNVELSDHPMKVERDEWESRMKVRVRRIALSQ